MIVPCLALNSVKDTLSGHFTGLDWLVLVGYIALTSILGVYLAGRQKDMKDFFRGGNKLPWYAVSGSIIATIISAVSFISVPAFAFSENGNFTYLQLGLIAGLLSRLFVAFVLVPAYYEHDVYSPYDYMGKRLGESARSVTTGLFTLLGVLAQAARVYLTAMILELILHEELQWVENLTGMSPLVTAVVAVGLVAVIWTLLGGIATVVWTDVMLFLVFITGAAVALGVIASHLPGGLGQIFSEGWAANKFQLWTLFDTSPDAQPGPRWMTIFTQPYTLLAAGFAVTFGNIGMYGTDQLLAQRIFCCRNKRAAQLAVISSWSAEIVTALLLLVGVGLWAFYQNHPEALSGIAGEKISSNKDTVLPVFILTQVPPGLTGLIIAGVFAAAISSLTSILAALAQTSLSAVYLPLRKIEPDTKNPNVQHNREILLVSRCLIIFWGIVLCLVAFGVDRYVEFQRNAGKDVLFLDLALGLANYVVGSLFAVFLLAWLPIRRNGYGLYWAAPLSVFMVWAARFHDPAMPRNFTQYLNHATSRYPCLTVCLGASGLLIGTWIIAALLLPHRRGERLMKTGWIGLGAIALIWMTARGWFPTFNEQGSVLTDQAGHSIKRIIAWPWYSVIGGATAFIFGYALGDRVADQKEQP